MSDAESDKSTNCAEESEERDPNGGTRGLLLARPPNTSNSDKPRRYCRFEHTEHEADCCKASKGGARCSDHENASPDYDVDFEKLSVFMNSRRQ